MKSSPRTTRPLGQTTRRLRAATVAGLLSVLLGASGGCQTTTHQANREQAQDRWSQVRAKVKHQLATQQYNAGHTTSAIKTANESLSLNPTDVETYVLLVRAFIESGDLPAAERAIRAAEGMGLDSAELAYLRGVLAERSRKLSSALDAYRRALRLDPTKVEYLVAEVECLVALQFLEEARRRVLDSLDDYDRDGTLDTLLAEVSLALGDDGAAAAAFQQAAPLVGADDLVAEEHGLALVRVGRFAEALAILKPLAEARADRELSGAAVRGVARCYLHLDKTDLADALLEDWLRGHPEDGASWLLKAKGALARGDLLAARQSADAAISLAPQGTETHLILGYACWRQGDFEHARTALEEALRLDPRDAAVHCLIGQVLADAGRLDEARDHLLESLELDPQSAWARDSLARLDSPASGRHELVSES